MRVLLKNKLPEDKWWADLAGKVVEIDKVTPGLGYRMIPVIDGNEFYIPEEAVEYVLPIQSEIVRLGIEVLEDGCEPEQHGDWVDVKTAEEIEMLKGEFKLIRLGFKASLPREMEAWLVLRSSSPKRYNIMQANSIGIIDNQYGEEWMLPVYAFNDTKIPKGIRIAQFRLINNQRPVHFYNTNVIKEGKTRSGFGSTGA